MDGVSCAHLTDAVTGPLGGFGRLIVDRDPLFTARFERLLASAGVELLRLPPRSPNLNAYAERFVRSIKDECLRRIIPLGERHLRTTIDEFVEHYMRSAITRASRIPFRSLAAPYRPAEGAFTDVNGSAACSTSTSETPLELNFGTQRLRWRKPVEACRSYDRSFVE